MLPNHTQLGELQIVEVYEYLDGPRLFSVKNRVGTKYLVYWYDETDDASVWLYMPISENRSKDLWRKKISFGEAFRDPEINYFLVKTATLPRNDEVKPITLEEIVLEYLPPDDFYLEYVELVDYETDTAFDFEVILDSKVKGKKASAEAVVEFVGRFREFSEELMNILADVSGTVSRTIYPLSALPGSIELRFGSNDSDGALKTLDILHQLLQSEEAQFESILLENKINPIRVKELLLSIKRNRLAVKLVPKLASDGETIEFPEESVDRCLGYISRLNTIFVHSSQIPQADDLVKVLLVPQIIESGRALTSESLEVVDRQVAYYRDAAQNWDLITREQELTAAGRYLNSLQDMESKYRVLADRFDSTEIGWAWMHWANVREMTDLDPNSAADFLLASSMNLSEVTARRRASTIRKWLQKLQPYHRNYISGEGDQ